jgi:hypothetical protein
MPSLLNPENLQAEALAICVAAGRPELEVAAEVRATRRKTLALTLTAWDPDGERNPLDCHCALVFGDTAEQVLERFAGKLGIAYPLPLVQYATDEQKRELISLGNHPLTSRPEKTRLLLKLPHLTEATAAVILKEHRALLEGRHKTQYSVVASAEFVQPVAVAA